MGVRTRGLDIKAGAAKLKADRAARVEAELVVDRWNRRLATGRDMLWSHTIRAALIAGTPWLDVFCPGCGTSRAIDLRTVDRHPLASVGTLVLGLRVRGVEDRPRCRSCLACTPCRPRTAPAKGPLDVSGINALSPQSPRRSAQPEVRSRVSGMPPNGWFLPRKQVGDVTRWRVEPRKQD
jgi:hypothetical protein